jgi:hypothetical protein
MPRLFQQLPGTQRSRAGILSTRFLLVLVGLAMLSGCFLTTPFRFNAEVKSLRAEAAQLFPPGSNAAEFEAWFYKKAVYTHKYEPSTNEVGPDKRCQMRHMSLRREEVCMNELTANYCVDDAGKLVSLEFEESGYC